MTIQEILEDHLLVKGVRGLETLCICGWHTAQRLRPEDLHRSHLAEVLDKHMQDREAAVLLKARDRMAKHWPLALDEFEAGEVCDWLELEVDKLKESTNGR